MTTLSIFLKETTYSNKLRSIISHIAHTGILIRNEIHISATKKDQSQNTSGDTQSALDITTDRIIKASLVQCDYVATAAS